MSTERGKTKGDVKQILDSQIWQQGSLPFPNYPLESNPRELQMKNPSRLVHRPKFDVDFTLPKVGEMIFTF